MKHTYIYIYIHTHIYVFSLYVHIYVSIYLYLSHFAIHLKLTQHGISTSIKNFFKPNDKQMGMPNSGALYTKQLTQALKQTTKRQLDICGLWTHLEPRCRWGQTQSLRCLFSSYRCTTHCLNAARWLCLRNTKPQSSRQYGTGTKTEI